MDFRQWNSMILHGPASILNGCGIRIVSGMPVKKGGFRNMKKTIAVISAAVMVLSLAACSNGGGTDNSKKPENAAGKTP